MKTEFNKEEWGLLAEMLREEIQECGALLNLLADQQDRILNRDSDAIIELTKSINDQIDENERRKERRQSYVCELAEDVRLKGRVATKSLIPFMPRPVQELISALVEELADLFVRCQTKAGQNQMLLARASEAVEQIIRMVEPEAASKTYDKKGTVDYGSSSKSSSVETSV